MTVQDDATSSVKETGTCEKIDTPLTQACSPDVLRDLLVKRNRVGAESREGRLLSNLIKQMDLAGGRRPLMGQASDPESAVDVAMRVVLDTGL